MAFGSPQWMYSSGSYELEQSLKLEDGDSAYLSWTPASAGNRRTWTWSGWVKRGEFSRQQTIFGAGNGGSIFDYLQFTSDDKLEFGIYSSATYGQRKSTAVFRDTSAWYHIVAVYDSTDSTALDRMKLYVNGERLTDFAATISPNQNFEGNINNNIIHTVGALFAGQLYNPVNGYLAEVNFIDGQALTPADFGETGTYGEWKPKEYSGTYGTNGFYLPFKQDYTVEGFSTVTWRGNGVSGNYIGGTGFKPDFTWIKQRSGVYSHVLADSVRGNGKFISSSNTGVEDPDFTKFQNFAADGFTVGTHAGVNSSGQTYVAWNWDMGADTPTGFSAVTYKGSGSVRDVSGFNFSPDLVWIKSLDHTYGHHWTDSVRGAGKDLYSNITDAEYSNANSLQVFKPDGFQLGTDNGVNNSTKNYVAWGWDMGNTTVTNTSGTISSQVRANTTYGQSIVTYDGNGTNNATVGHGLSSAPELVIIKRTDAATNWNVGANAIGWANHLYLNTTSGQLNGYNPITGQASTLEISSDSDVNNSSGSYVAYCFHDVANYSKFGSYTGNASANGPSVTTGFRPAFLLVKKTTGSADWHLFDNVRGTTVDNKEYLKPNSDAAEATSAAEATIFDFNATGFQAKGSSADINGNGETYIYMAFAGGMDSISDYNTNGSIDSRVKANPTYGQSIVSYTGNGTAGATVGHGLSSAPEMMLVKSRSHAKQWAVYHTSLGNTHSLKLNDDSATYDNVNRWNDTTPTSTVFSLGSSDESNYSGTNIAYCFHSVTGYSKFGSYTGNGSTAGPTVTLGFRPAFVVLKPSSAVDHWNLYDTTRDPQNPINHLLFPNRDNAEGTGQDIEISDTGFQLKTTNTGSNGNGTTYIYMAFADTREYAYWLDQSGNNNDWASNNLTESDISVDSPTNNFATLNPLDSRSTVLAEGNLQNTPSGSNHWGTARSTFAMPSGSWYAEFYCKAGTGNGNNFAGIATQSEPLTGISNSSTPLGFSSTSWGYSDNDNIYNNGSIINSTGTTWVTGDIIGVTFTGTVLKFYKNNSLIATVSNIPVNDYCFTTNSWTTSMSMIANFGQDSSFAGNKTAQGNQDSNDIGDFYYTPPTGFLALCTKNLPDVAVTPSEHFDVVTYTGTGSGQAVAVNFQPDFSWIKVRSVADGSVLSDAVRGATKFLSSTYDSAEVDNSAFVSAFTSTGLTLGGNRGVSQSSFTYVAWNWKANGSGSSNTDGSITSTVSANTDAGFSIISYTGNGSNNQTLGHGLSKAPEIGIFKERGGSASWEVETSNITGTIGDLLYLNLANAKDSATTDFSAKPTSSVFQIGGSNVNENNMAMICYAFHSVDGYSKIGTYETNGASGDNPGAFVYLGFRPAFVMIKSVDHTNGYTSWVMYDNKRNGYNRDNEYVFADTNEAEMSTYIIHFYSNGFQVYDNYHATNNSGTYMYIAFAETPFKYSNAR